MPEKECEDLIKEVNEAARYDLRIAASIYEDAAKCYDENGNREKSAQCLTVAGDFFLDLVNMDKAATCYGKAIMRYLMIDDLEKAQLLINKGKSYGFPSTTYHYRIALDAMDRKSTLKFDKELKETENLSSEIKLVIKEDQLPDIDILPIEEEEEDLIPFNSETFRFDEDIKAIEKDFLIPQLEKEDLSAINSFTVLAVVSKTTREKIEHNIQTNAVVRDKSGDSRYIQPKLSLNSISSIEDPENSKNVSNKKEISIDSLSNAIEEIKLENDDLSIYSPLIETDTIDLDYSAKTELLNEYEEELTDIEIVDTIPFRWQVIDINSDFILGERRSTDEGVVFTWRKSQIDPGSKASIEYILRKRVERSIILRKENNKVAVINLFHSINQDLETELNFVNTSGKKYQEILIEDVIPPELIVKNIKSPWNFKPVTIPTHDSTLYRWIFSNMNPGDNFIVNYKFREKPLTRHYIDEFESNLGNIKIEKISQPIIDSLYYEYIWFYTIENKISNEIKLYDRIPSNYDVIQVDPLHLRPSKMNEKTYNLLTWKIPSDSIFTLIIIKIRGPESFTPLAPSIELSQKEQFQLVNKEITSETKLINLKRLQKQMKGVD